ncbi:DNA polymerase LigD, polymerase domain protein [Segniliparus rotundus DSM 44985]|uniref:DNA polymerase LigD, polymerase domain protein n=1 Tax=Segniliparus rotundus (strain ATCC BAA-972 / CDC 1076 / CIP 108378 / DSM 44985 / JCM 13578) TaxID=640132 RepID=D6ZAP8_SEGRD|nr:DNA polymerase domain-containing protein [Segniliparus rotundus]ADG98784.1 DNA polymerase LigD, polymerase domain protein [Segniliparus rotundus DSM 44985]
MASKREVEEIEADGVVVRLSNPDKRYFPKLGAGGSKRVLFEHYRKLAVGNGPIMRALRGRPVNLQRFPEGIEGEAIYQKHAPKGKPDHVETARVLFPSGRGADSVVLHHPADVLWAVNLGTVTFHPWPCHAPDTEHPDELRVDLDPQPGTSFEDARRVALDVPRPLLDELGLAGVPKTSGGRGLHVLVPIRPRWEFAEVRRAGIALAQEVVRRADDRATFSWWKEERGERIFIDYNQNARDRTLAAPYAVRPTANATVSMPLTWAELETARPEDFTVANAAEHALGAPDPFAGRTPGSLDKLLEQDTPLLPYPPQYPKMPDEPKRVQPSKDKGRKRG